MTSKDLTTLIYMDQELSDEEPEDEQEQIEYDDVH